jgi:hypothetical protein
MLETLAGVAASEPEGFERLARAALAHCAQLTSCVLVLVAWNEARRGFAARLAASGVEVRAILVCARDDAPREAPAWLLVVHPGEIEAGLARLERMVLR